MEMLSGQISYGDYLMHNYPGKNLYSKKYPNYIIPAAPEHTASAHFEKSLRRLHKWHLHYDESSKVDEILSLYKTLYAGKTGISNSELKRFSAFCHQLARQSRCITRQVFKDQQLVAGVLLLLDGKRVYNMISCITEEGKRLEANYFLYNNMMHAFKSMHMIFDLEGSHLPGVAAFYLKMNPLQEDYYHLHINNLPWPVNWLKK